MSPLRTLIVDDEPLAREKLRTLLASDPEIEIVGECASGALAVAAIREHRPDLLFLDVQLPERDGFQVVEAVGVEHMPVTVFVTAFDRYALKAFEAQALDYLLKPFDRERFEQALRRAKQAVGRGKASELNRRLTALLEQRGVADVRRFAIRSAGRERFVEAGELEWIESAGNYVRLHLGSEEHLLRATLAALEGELVPRGFVRTHRSALVNCARVRELRTASSGDGTLLLESGATVAVSRTHRTAVERRLRESPAP